MTSPDSAAESLLFPVGHYMGAFYPAVGAPLKYHRVRVADRSVRLDSADEAAVWALAHGVPDIVEHVAWTRAKVEDLARDSGLAKPGAVVDEFLDEGILAEVTPGAPDAVDFARRHTVQPLMVGMGNTAAEPLGFRIGYGEQPSLEVPGSLYELWQWGRLFDLWQVCELFADVARESQPDDRDAADPERILTDFLTSLHILLSHNAVYLDESDTTD